MNDDWLARVRRVAVWRRAGERAPHRPLLMLYALGRTRAGHDVVEWPVARKELGQLLLDFGPPRKPRPEFPFTRLRNDGLWVLREGSGKIYDGPADAIAPLTSKQVSGELPLAFRRRLLSDDVLTARVAGVLLDAHFPSSLHDDVCAAVGLDVTPLIVGSSPVNGRRRDPKFRPTVLSAFNGRCALCGYAGTLEGAPVGVEAAHIRWFSAAGPDELTNSLCLCSLHHRLLDRGAFAFTDNLTVVASQHFAGAATGAALTTGQQLWLPAGVRPDPGHVRWHRREVFRA